MKFDYKIKESKEKDGKVIVEVEIENNDLSKITKEILKFSKLTTNEEVLNYLNNAVSSGLITVDEGQAFYDGRLSDEKMLEVLEKLSGGVEKVSETVEFTVIKKDDKVVIDEIDNVDDFVAIVSCNIVG